METKKIEIPPAYIIDDINRREREKREQDRPVLRIPTYEEDPSKERRETPNEEKDIDGNRGVVEIHM